MTKLPPGVVIETPTKRRAIVKFYDSDERVHIEYLDGTIDRSGNPETGCFPGRLAKLPVNCDKWRHG